MNERNTTVEVTCPECDRKVQLRGVVPYVTNTATKCNRGFWGCDVASCPALRGAVAAALSRPRRVSETAQGFAGAGRAVSFQLS
jgi:hypothetical protein